MITQFKLFESLLGEEDWGTNESFFDRFKKTKVNNNLKPIEDEYQFISLKDRIDTYCQKFLDEDHSGGSIPLGIVLLRYYKVRLIGKRIRIKAKKEGSPKTELHDFILSDIDGNPWKLNYRLIDTEGNFYHIHQNNTPLLQGEVYQKIINNVDDPFNEEDWDD
jgi:hypothetical protein